MPLGRIGKEIWRNTNYDKGRDSNKTLLCTLFISYVIRSFIYNFKYKY